MNEFSFLIALHFEMSFLVSLYIGVKEKLSDCCDCWRLFFSIIRNNQTCQNNLEYYFGKVLQITVQRKYAAVVHFEQNATHFELEIFNDTIQQGWFITSNTPTKLRRNDVTSNGSGRPPICEVEIKCWSTESISKLVKEFKFKFIGVTDDSNFMKISLPMTGLPERVHELKRLQQPDSQLEIAMPEKIKLSQSAENPKISLEFSQTEVANWMKKLFMQGVIASDGASRTTTDGVLQARKFRHDCRPLSYTKQNQIEMFTVTQMEIRPQCGTEINGKGVKIAIIDLCGDYDIGTSPFINNDGFHYMHDTFSSRSDRTATVSGPQTLNFEIDKSYHATTCASIAIGTPFKGCYRHNKSMGECDYPGGVAPGVTAKIFLIKNVREFLQALHLIDNEKYDVISISLVLEKEPIIEKKLIELSESTLMFAAAGNSGNLKGVVFPANIEQVVSVGSLTEDGKESSSSPSEADIYCYGHVSAPITDESNRALNFVEGTSMAAPAIAGTACLILQCAQQNRYLTEAIKESVLSDLKKKENMLNLLRRAVTDTRQFRPAKLLEDAFNASNKNTTHDNPFIQWYKDLPENIEYYN